VQKTFNIQRSAKVGVLISYVQTHYQAFTVIRYYGRTSHVIGALPFVEPKGVIRASPLLGAKARYLALCALLMVIGLRRY